MSRLKVNIEMETIELSQTAIDHIKEDKNQIEKDLAKRLIREFDGSVVTVNIEVIEDDH